MAHRWCPAGGGRRLRRCRGLVCRPAACPGTAWLVDRRVRSNANPADTRDVPRATTPTTPAKRGTLGRLDGPVWWPTYGYDSARTRVSPPYGLRPPFRRVWRFRAALSGVPAGSRLRPRLRAAAARSLLRAGRDNEKILWSHHFRRCLASSPTVAEGVVYQGMMHPLPCGKGGRSSARGDVRRHGRPYGQDHLAARTGVVESSPCSSTVGCTSAPGTTISTRFVLATEGSLALQGRRRAPQGARIRGSNGLHRIARRAVHAVDARTGRARWLRPRSRGSAGASTSTPHRRSPTVGSTPRTPMGRIYAFGAGTGRLLWAKHAGTYVYTAPAVWRKRVFVGTYDGWVMALDAATGDTRWRQAAPAAVPGAPRCSTVASTSPPAARVGGTARATRNAGRSARSRSTRSPSDCSGAFPTAATPRSSPTESGCTSSARPALRARPGRQHSGKSGTARRPRNGAPRLTQRPVATRLGR